MHQLCGQLAFEMFLHGATAVQVSQSQSQPQSRGAPTAMEDDPLEVALSDVTAPSAAAAAADAAIATRYDDWAATLLLGDERGDGKAQVDLLRLRRLCSPLRKSCDVYSFLHKSVQEYFAALHICKQLAVLVSQHGLGSSQMDALAAQPIAQKLLTDDYGVLQFAAEFVDQRVWQYAPQWPAPRPLVRHGVCVFQPQGKALFDVVEASRDLSWFKRTYSNCRPWAVAAANAVSVLNASGTRLARREWSGVVLGGDWKEDAGRRTLPWADLSGAVLSGSDLRGAQ